MNMTLEQCLADALRAIIEQRDYHAEHGSYRPGTMGEDQCFDDWAADIAETVLAAYDAQQAAAPSGWAHEGDTIYRDDGIAIAHCFSEQSTAATVAGEHTAARIVQCVNAHDGLVSALHSMVIAVDCAGDVETIRRVVGEQARSALAQAGVHHA